MQHLRRREQLRIRALLLAWVLLQATPLAAQDSLKEALQALRRGRSDLVLRLVSERTIPERVVRLHAYVELGELTQAEEALRSLEQEEHGAFPTPFDFRFYLLRGRVETAAARYSLALKNYREAQRRARSPEQELEVKMAEVECHLHQDDIEAAEKEFGKSGPLLRSDLDPSLLAKHLELSAQLLHRRGERVSALLSVKAARELYLSQGQPSRAAQALLSTRAHLPDEGKRVARFRVLQQAIEEYSAIEHDPAVIRCLAQLEYSYYQLAETSAKREIEKLFENSLKQMSSEALREKALLTWANFRLDTGDLSEDLLSRYQSLTESEDPELRCLAHQGVALYFGGKGERERSLEEFGKALELARPQLKQDPEWRRASGRILLAMAAQERSRHRYEEALELGRRGIAQQSGPDWLAWRVRARYETLMAAVEASDLEAAEVEFRESLREIDTMKHTDEKAGSLTTILASLLLNQSVESDLLDPSGVILGEYSDLAVELLERVFSEGEEVDRYLALFDLWYRELKESGEVTLLTYPMIYKGLILEALGRLPEARAASESGLELSRKHDVKGAQMLSRILLARLDYLEGKEESAVAHTTAAAEVALQLNPIAGRFYLLSAGGAQRRAGRLTDSLASFTKALELRPEQAWPALYGRALVLEQMGREAEALEDLKRALRQVSVGERVHSVAEIQATRARLLARLGKQGKAKALYREAHENLGYSGALPRVTLEYGDLFQATGEARQALELYTGTLDHLAELHFTHTPQTRKLFESTVTLALQLDEVSTALKYLKLSRSLELLDSIDIDRISTGDQDTTELFADVKKLKLRMAKLGEQSGTTQDAGAREAIGRRLAATRGEFFAKLDELKRREPDFESLVQVTGSQLSVLQGLLDQKTAMLEYFPAENTLYVFVVTSEGLSIHQLSLSREELERKVGRLLALCTDPDSDLTELESLARSLHASLVGVVGRELDQVENLLLVPSGPLWELPFAVLRSEDGHRLGEQYRLGYLGSSELLKLTSKNQTESFSPGSVLLVQGAQELRGAQKEIETLASELQGSLVLSGSELTERTFREALEGRRFLHIASHSVVSRECGQSYVELGREHLSLEEIYSLELEPGSTVVLSSCRSGVGLAVPGREVTSLSSAFSVAGASRVIASRWPVDDQATSDFFIHFYEELQKGAAVTDALQAAQVWMTQTKSHPYYWAAFHLLGSPEV